MARFDMVHDAQDVYRRLLDAMARPGKINDLGPVREKIPPEAALAPGLAVMALTLLDGEVSFAVLSQAPEAAERYLKWSTRSRPAPLTEADYIFVDKHLNAGETAALLQGAKRGTLLRPDQSATLFLAVTRLAAPGEGVPGTIHLRLKGPGIPGERPGAVVGLPRLWIAGRCQVNSEYPLGIDMVLVDSAGRIMALPRTTTVEEGAPVWDM